MIFPAVFAIVVGFGMIAMWTVSYLSKQIPELEDEPIRIKFHLAAEFVTAVLLTVAGIALFLNLDWAVSAISGCHGMSVLYGHCKSGILCPERAVGICCDVCGDPDPGHSQPVHCVVRVNHGIFRGYFI